jgi:hypothetical protein
MIEPSQGHPPKLQIIESLFLNKIEHTNIWKNNQSRYYMLNDEHSNMLCDEKILHVMSCPIFLEA